jgi:hypothetical protein
MKRRDFLRLPAIAAVLVSRKRKNITAITTTYFLRSHADDIITGFWKAIGLMIDCTGRRATLFHFI